MVPESLQQWLVGVQGQGIMGNGNGSAFEVVQGETIVCNVLFFAFGSVSKDNRHSMWWQEVLLLKNIRCWNIKIKTYPDLVSLALFSAPACCSCFSLLLHPRYRPMPVPSPNWFILLFFLGFVTYLSLFASLGVSGCCKMGLLYWARLFPIQCDCCSSILLLWANTCWLRSLISRRGPTSVLLGACCASKDDFSWNSLPCSWQMVSGWGCLPIAAAAVFSASVPREIYPLYKMSSITFCWKLNSVTMWAGTSPGRVGSWRLWRRPSGPWSIKTLYKYLASHLKLQNLPGGRREVCVDNRFRTIQTRTLFGWRRLQLAFPPGELSTHLSASFLPSSTQASIHQLWQHPHLQWTLCFLFVRFHLEAGFVTASFAVCPSLETHLKEGLKDPPVLSFYIGLVRWNRSTCEWQHACKSLTM